MTFIRAALVFLFSTVIAFAGDMATLSGTVTKMDRMALPPGTVVQVKLEDVSRADAMSFVLSTISFAAEGQVPYAFELDYDASLVDPRYTYAVSASFWIDGKRIYLSTSRHDAFAEPLEIIVDRIAD